VTLEPPASNPEPRQTEILTKRAPTLYIIIFFKLLKGVSFLALAFVVYALSDNDLPAEYHNLLHMLRLNPERKFFADLAVSIGQLTEKNVVWTAAGTLVYSLFSLVEGVGLMFRSSWAGWLAIGESAFFIPIEMYELVSHVHVKQLRFPWFVFGILVCNVVIVWYLFQNRERLFRHHHH
jgi:uncharacterized membrane protein (DUF2068 family)